MLMSLLIKWQVLLVTFAKDESVYNWGDACHGLPNVNNQGRALSCSKSAATLLLLICYIHIRAHLRVENAGIGDIESWYVEFFEHNFSHAFSVGGGVPCRFCH